MSTYLHVWDLANIITPLYHNTIEASCEHNFQDMTRNKEFMDDQLAAMLQQEKKFYSCSDYLETWSSSSDHAASAVCPLQILNELANLVTDTQCVRIEESSASSESGNTHATPTTVMLDVYATTHTSRPLKPKQWPRREKIELSLIASWRHQMFDWICQVVRCKHLGNGTVEVSFSILDRFMAIKLRTQSILREEFYLYSLVSLYIAFKTSATDSRLTLNHLISMMRGVYQADDFEAAELEILETLQWHVNPPTIMDFCDLYLSLDKTQLPKNTYNVCEYMTEVAIADEFFISKPCSKIALGITLLATRKRGVKFAWTKKFLHELRGRVFVEGDEFESILQQLEHLCF